MKCGFFIKRQDACSFLRVHTPMSHLGFMGHECREVLVEQVAVCQSCTVRYNKAQNQQEIETSYVGDTYVCEKCFTPLMSGLNEWKKKVYEQLDWCEIAIFQRNTDISHLQLMKEAKKRWKFVVVESDDNYLSVPEDNPGYKYYMQRSEIIKEMFRIADAHTVTTESLKEFYSEYNSNIQVIPNAYDLDIFDATPAFPDVNIFKLGNERVSLDQFNEVRKDKKFVCWAGSPTHQRDLEIVIDPLKQMFKKENAILGMVTFILPEMIASYPRDKLFMFGITPVYSWFSMLKTLVPDVYIAPVVKNEFNSGKSCLKLIEAAMMGSIPVMSDFDTYNQTDFSVFLAEDNNWGTCLHDALHLGEKEKEEMISHNKKVLYEQYDIKVTVKIWDEFFRTGVAK